MRTNEELSEALDRALRLLGDPITASFGAGLLNLLVVEEGIPRDREPSIRMALDAAHAADAATAQTLTNRVGGSTI